MPFETPYSPSTHSRTPEARSEKREAPQMEIHAATASSIERPDHNEDAYFFSLQRGLMALFDGLGGSLGGDYAAAVAAAQVTKPELLKHLSSEDTETKHMAEIFLATADQIQDQTSVEQAVKTLLIHTDTQIAFFMKHSPGMKEQAIEYFNRKLKQSYGAFDPEDEEHARALQNILESAASTAVIAKQWRDKKGETYLTVGNLGDSRAYLLRDGELTRLTIDDSPIQVLQTAGVMDIEGRPLDDQQVNQRISKEKIIAAADKYPELEAVAVKLISAPSEITIRDLRSSVTQAVGLGSKIKRETRGGRHLQGNVRTITLQPGDRILLTSDGETDNLLDTEIKEEVAQGDISTLPARICQSAQSRSRDRHHPRAKADDATALAAEFKA